MSKMKYSKQRDALLTLIRSTRSHPSADWLYENLRKDFPNISLGTVYRNLSVLVENGDIIRIRTASNKEHFDGFVYRHHHFVCRRCDKILDVDIDGMDAAEEQAAQKLGAQVEDYSLVFYGICSDCQKN
ncbi:MAG: transcriptional repressor [Oscillospiraceae bacterium]|nr:transcriptional repressor [Oscillospiraceae bacterium]